jgi:hypothetical protein
MIPVDVAVVVKGAYVDAHQQLVNVVTPPLAANTDL